MLWGLYSGGEFSVSYLPSQLLSFIAGLDGLARAFFGRAVLLGSIAFPFGFGFVELWFVVVGWLGGWVGGPGQLGFVHRTGELSAGDLV